MGPGAGAPVLYSIVMMCVVVCGVVVVMGMFCGEDVRGRFWSGKSV